MPWRPLVPRGWCGAARGSTFISSPAPPPASGILRATVSMTSASGWWFRPPSLLCRWPLVPRSGNDVDVRRGRGFSRGRLLDPHRAERGRRLKSAAKTGGRHPLLAIPHHPWQAPRRRPPYGPVGPPGDEPRGWCGADRGTTIITTPAPPTATGIIRTTVTITSASGWWFRPTPLSPFYGAGRLPPRGAASCGLTRPGPLAAGGVWASGVVR